MPNNSVEAYIRQKFGDIQLKPMTFGGTNFVNLLEGTEPPRVAKIAGLNGADIINEYHCLRYISQCGFVPNAESIATVGDNTVLIMEARPGENLLGLILEHTENKTRDVLQYYRLMGRFLAAIHSWSKEVDPNIRRSELKRVGNELLKDSFVPTDLARLSWELIAEIQESEADWVLTHGDYGAHNILIDDVGDISVIDWEFGEWNHPLSDIANVHFWTHFHFPDSASERCKAFLETYQSYRQIQFSGELLNSYCIYRIWVILLRVGALPEKVKAEWVRRLRWAIQHDFVA